ncbi:urea ABC transporter permease subunit UrtB [Roseovarius tibetensis]|uniref:urea ABC transporter permease subunit UrtB n=1 Tax=Roseovarius tibetensis TaxID=2685897 RepID=UPI003D7F22AD
MLVILACAMVLRPDAVAAQEDLQPILQEHRDALASPSRRTIGPVIADLINSDHPGITDFLRKWEDREVYLRPDDGQFFYAEEAGDDLRLIDIDNGAAVDVVGSRAVDQIRPNAGVRRELAAALVPVELTAPDPARRQAALDAIMRSADASQIAPLADSIDSETEPEIRTRKARLLALLKAQFGATKSERLDAIAALAGDTSIEARGVLNQLTATRDGVADTLPGDANIARVLEVGSDITEAEAHNRLVAAGLAPPRRTAADLRDVLAQHIVDGRVGGVPVHRLDTLAGRAEAYEALEAAGTVPPRAAPDEVATAVAGHVFYAEYLQPDPEITRAAQDALDATARALGLYQTADMVLDGLSLASIFFLAAIGLAITFGVMGVINMAHGEFIMMGAYTGYVVQILVPDYTVSLLIALPLAFAVTFGAGVAMERLVIRHLYTRPLETLLATFGLSIALQQLAKNIFGTQARPLTAPDWLGGAITLNDTIGISTIRVAIFVLALIFLAVLLYILRRTRLGLEVRAVTQNPGMAASMGINPDRINMLTFGLGSGIAGVAGVAIGLYAQVTSEMGANYIVQSFMTVVVGGVGNVWGTLAGASLIGFLQKGIEWLNPSNTLAAQTWMVLFVILFIQFRPRGIVALKGRAAGD